ncbi:FkbM family methyltransferase [Candidatus Woesearchaeota archaeon]|nr:FkbM family methyltransferase [Candidatus Woesearchaeota archaeon]
MSFNVLNDASGFIVSLASSGMAKKIVSFINKHFSPEKDIMVKVGMHKMYASTLDRIFALLLWKFSALEAFETKLLGKIVKKGMVVYDIGANVGYYTLIFAHLVGRKGRVYAFEPEPENYRLLLKNIRASNCRNVIAIKKAVSDKSGKVKFFVSEAYKGDHSMSDLGAGSKLIEVDSITIDNFVRNKAKPGFIKIDVEGAEFLAVKGMGKLLDSGKGVKMVCEFYPKGLIKCGDSPGEFLSRLESHGFKIKLINEKKKRIEPIGSPSLIKLCSGSRYANILLER